MCQRVAYFDQIDGVSAWYALLYAIRGWRVKHFGRTRLGKALASASGDDTLKLWDVNSGTEIRSLAGHSGEVWAVAFSPDGKTLASASSDKTLKLWWAVRQPRLSDPADTTGTSE